MIPPNPTGAEDRRDVMDNPDRALPSDSDIVVQLRQRNFGKGLLEDREAFFDMIRDKVITAYMQGAMDVHENWQEDRDPDFTEAAHNYYASVVADDASESHSPPPNGKDRDTL
jgi:hypothetical protein